MIPRIRTSRDFLCNVDLDPGVKAAKRDASCTWRLEEMLWKPVGPPLDEDNFDDYAVTRAIGAVALDQDQHDPSAIVVPSA
jgi:hypothetical protein